MLNPALKYSDRGLKMTARFEGCRLKAYKDQVGVLTIGYGHTLGVVEGMECTMAQALAWLEQDIARVETQLNRDLKIQVDQDEFDALVDFAFNLGLHALEHSTLWAKLNKGDFAGAAAEFPRWSHAGGKEVEGLLKRRLEEQALFLHKAG